jgi:rhamnose transport system ATP-binding protein
LTEQPVLSAIGVSRRFGAVVALKGVDLDVYAGEVHAICGENGAGKSTLMAILAGSLRPDSGELRLDAKPFSPANPAEATAAGIGIVYQERSLLPNMSVAENICLGTVSLGRGWLVDRPSMSRRSTELLSGLDPGIDPSALVGNLSVAHQQVVEIAKATAREPRILILDEPTASIGVEAAKRLFAITRRMRARGLAVVYISHHLDEVFRIADRVTVLRNGERIGTWPVADIDEQRLVSAMVGRSYSHGSYVRSGQAGADHKLVVHGLSRPGEFENVSLEVRSGEILALAGLVGAGRTEVGETIFGVRRPQRGSILLEGRPLPPGRPDVAIRRGLCMLTEDRKERGLFLDMAIRDNVAAPNLWRLTRLGLVDGRSLRRTARRFLDELRIRAPSIDVVASSLSGGNQQKLLLAMWLAARPRLLIVDEPTKGVDVGARDEIHRFLASMADQGAGILLISSDQAEVHRLADRVLVMRRGCIVAELPARASEEDIVAFASGARDGAAA